MLLCAAAGLSAQKIQAPLLAYVWDASAAQLRPVWGSAGAATLGDPVPLPLPVSLAAVSPRQDYVLALTGETGQATLLDPRTGAARKLAGVRAGAGKIALSPDGSAAALYFEQAGLIQVVAGLPDAPDPPSTLFLPELSAPLTRLAVGDGAGFVLFTDASGEATAISTGPDRLHSRIALAGPVNAIAFFPHGGDALLASDSEVVRVALGENARTVLGSGFPGPAWAAVSRDGSLAVLANAAGIVRVFHPDAGPAAALDFDCHCTPGEIARTNGLAVFRLSGDTAAALPLLDAGRPQLQMSVVPPMVDLN